MDEVEAVGDQCPRRGGMGLADHRQLGHRVLAQRGSPVASGCDHRVTVVAGVSVDDGPLDREPELGHLGQTACAQRLGSAVQQLPRRRLLVRRWRLVGEEGGGHASFYRTYVRQATVVGACLGRDLPGESQAECPLVVPSVGRPVCSIVSHRSMENVVRRPSTKTYRSDTCPTPSCDGLLPAIATLWSAPPAHADTTSFSDPRGDAPSASISLGPQSPTEQERVVVKQQVRDLRGSGSQIFGFNVVAGSEALVVQTIRRGNGAVTVRVIGERECAGVRASWRIASDEIRFSMPRDCIGQDGAIRVSTLIGAGDGTAGDPADWTKAVRVDQS